MFPLPRRIINGQMTDVVFLYICVDTFNVSLEKFVELRRDLASSDHDTTRGGPISKSVAVSPRLSRNKRTPSFGGRAQGVGPMRQTCLRTDSS